MRKDSDYRLEVSSGSPLVEPEITLQPRSLKVGVVRELGARADIIAVIDNGDQVTFHDDAEMVDDIRLAHLAQAVRLCNY